MRVKKGVKYSDVLNKEKKKKKLPAKPSFLLRSLIRIVSIPDLMSTDFKYEKIGMEKLGRKEPCLILMNHSSFIDLNIAVSVLYPRPLNIVSTLDAFIGKPWLMRNIGCIPTRKFVADIGLVRDINTCIKKLGTSVLMYPEAGYSFDGTSTVLPKSLAQLVKRLGVPLVMLKTSGAYHRQPLYNNLRRRKVKISAELRYVLSPEDIQKMPYEEIERVLEHEFSFDNFKWQQQDSVKIDEPTRAEGLHRLLYKCPECKKEGRMSGEGTTLKCTACGALWELDEYGFMVSSQGKSKYAHIPDWYAWERQCVREELEDGKYGFETAVDIYAVVDTKCVYEVGSGSLSHTQEGFSLKGCDGRLEYFQKSASLYTLNSDFYWYSLGDVIGIGDNNILYYCMPRTDAYLVTKARLATEEIYKNINQSKK